MAPLSTFVILGLAASVLGLPYTGQTGHGTHSHPTGTHLHPSGTYMKSSGTGVRSHGLPSGTKAPSGVKSHSHKTSQLSVETPIASSDDSIENTIAAKYNAVSSAAESCSTVTTKIKVTVTITADETASTTTPSTHVLAASSSAVLSASTTELTSSSSVITASVDSLTANLIDHFIVPSSYAHSAMQSVASAVSLQETTTSTAAPATTHTTTSHSTMAYTPVVSLPIISISSVMIPAILSTTAQSSTVAATTAASSGTSSKRGVAYNDASLTDDVASSSKIGWAYNWGSSSGTLASGLKFIPTLWGPKSTFTDSWAKNAQSAISSGSTHLFSFNEPDMASQSNMTASVAAAAYKTWISDGFKNSGAKLCAPSVTNGDPAKGYGLGWLSSFMTACKDCKIDCINIHWYGDDVNDLKTHVAAAVAQAALSNIGEVWLTEFGLNGQPAASTISTFLQSAMPFLDAQQNLTGYAYFMLSDGILVNGNSLNAAGQTYLNYA